MAPNLALDTLRGTRSIGTVLDPMCGSGTVLKLAVEEGWTAFGYDTDPLTVLLSRVACTTPNELGVIRAAEQMVEKVNRRRVRVPWIDGDQETRSS